MRHVLEMVGFDFIRGYNFGEGVLFWGQLDYSESLVHFSMLSGEPCALSPVVRAHRYFTIEDTPTSVNIKIYNIPDAACFSATYAGKIVHFPVIRGLKYWELKMEKMYCIYNNDLEFRAGLSKSC